MIIILYENHSNVGEKWVCNIDIIMSGSTMHDVYTYDLTNEVMRWYCCVDEWICSWLILWLNAWCTRVYVKVICHGMRICCKKC